MAGTERDKATGRRRNSMDLLPPTVSDIRMVLVGKTGAGKSSSGNTLLGGDFFRASLSHYSVTKECCKESSEVFGRKLTVVDTPGLFDTSQPDDAVNREISKCINMSAPGPHAILLTIKYGPFSAEEREAVRRVEEIFGPEAWRYTIILFTHGDKAESDLETDLQGAGDDLQSILKKVDHRYHIFNNRKISDRSQVLGLLEKVEQMVAANGGQFYSNYTYQEVVRMLEEREAELTQLYDRRLREEMAAVQLKYEQMLSERQQEQEHQHLEERLHSELEELKRYYGGLQSRAHSVVEQMMAGDPHQMIFSSFPETLQLKFNT